MIDNGAYGEPDVARYLHFERAATARDAGWWRVRVGCDQASRAQGLL